MTTTGQIDIRELINFFPFFMLTVVNIYWTWKAKKVQNDRDIIKALQLQIETKDGVINDMVQKKNEIKLQFSHQQELIKKLEGEIKTYKAFHGHKQTEQHLTTDENLL